MEYREILAALSVVVLTIEVSGQANKAEVLLGSGLHQEDVEGNCTEAIKTYQKVIQEKDAPKAIAGRAQLRIASCQEKLGLQEARAAYEMVLNRYADQSELVAQARGRLANLGSAQQAIERIWVGPDVDMEGRPSDDGRYFVVADWSTGLVVRDLKTGERRLVVSGTAAGEGPENPLLSPDGKRIAYRFGDDDDSTIRLINAGGSSMRVLLRDRHDNYLAAWSPDGKYLAAVHDNGDRTETIVLISTTDGEIKQLKSTGSQGVSVGGFSPDGRFLVYAKNNDPKEGDGGVFVMAADGSEGKRLVEGSRQGPTTFSDPFWSPDGQRVVFMSNRSGTPGMWSVRVANGTLEPVRVSVDNMYPRGLTKDGSLYYVKREILVEAYTAEFDPMAMKVLSPAPITDRAVGNNRGPEMSPDGSSVAFIRRRVGMPWAIVVRSLATDGAERVVGTINDSGAYGARTLQWFPDGRSLLVIDRVDGPRTRFRRIDLNTSDAKVVFDGPWFVWTGAVSADGEDVFYSVREAEEGIVRLVRRNLDTGAEKELYRVKTPGAGFFGLVASPDGAWLAFECNVDADRRALFVLSTEGGAPRQLYQSTFGGGIWLKDIQWTSDSRTLVLVGDSAGPGESLYVIPAAGGSLKPLGLSMEEISTPAISPDGRRIVFGGRTVRRELWVVRNLLSDLAKAR